MFFSKVCLVVWAAVSVAVPASACSSPQDVPEKTSATATAPILFNIGSIDSKTDPCADFYQYANGTWLARNPIPPDQTSWGWFNVVAERTQAVLRQILEADSAEDLERAPVEQKIGDYYASCMDTGAIDLSGVKPLEPELARIAQIQNLKDLQAEIARLQGEGVNALFHFGSAQDFKDSNQVIAVASQGGLGLPDRDYYTKTDPHSRQIRAAYIIHMAKMFELLGDSASTADNEAKIVLSIETVLAEGSMTQVERRKPEAIYHKISVDELQGLTPNFQWQVYLRDVGSPDIREVDVEQPEFFKSVNRALESVGLADWRVYLRWHLIRRTAVALPPKFLEEYFDFYRRTLSGAKEMPVRWKVCVGATNNALGFALGQAYVKRVFPPEAKTVALTLVHNLIAALREDISAVNWMTPETRKQALLKLDSIRVQIGYPDKWLDYSAFHVIRGPYVENFLRGSAFDFRRDLAKIGKPVDLTEWALPPQTVDAYSSGSMHEVVFPAGMLQPPFFDSAKDDAVNYGAIGAAIGHELTHQFDDTGRKFDAKGNLRDWWTADDEKQFQARADCLVEEYGSFTAEGDLKLNGKLTLGENIGDSGGLRIAYLAFEATQQSKPAKTVDSFSPEQRFFLAFAQMWAQEMTPELARLTALTNPHSPGRFRVNGVLSNMPEFQQAFRCAPNAPMVRKKACQVW